jgi:flagellar basal body-associated protein FliL
MAGATAAPDKKAPAKTEEKPVETGREPLWSRTGLLIMIAVWVATLAIGVGGVALFMGTPSATDVPARSEKEAGAGRAFGMIERVQVGLTDETGDRRTVTFNLLLDFGDNHEKARAELDQANFKNGLAYQAEEVLRGYTVRQVQERSFSREFGEAAKKRLNELYTKDGQDYVRDVLIQNLSVSG